MGDDIASGQLSERPAIKRVWARDVWHVSRRLPPNMLVHTASILLKVERGSQPLHLAQLLS